MKVYRVKIPEKSYAVITLPANSADEANVMACDSYLTSTDDLWDIEFVGHGDLREVIVEEIKQE